MASTIVHFGRDDCARLLVLKTAGYEILDCGLSTQRLRKSLERPHEAVVVSECVELSRSEVLPLMDTLPAPVILFESVEQLLEPTRFDLVVPSLTAPEYWLERVSAVIARSKLLSESSRAIRARSAEILAGSRKVREESRAERLRSRKLREDSES